MSSPDRPNEPELSPWKGRAKALKITELWRVFCDAQLRRLNSPEPVRTGAGGAAGAVDELAAVPPEDRAIVIVTPGGPGVEMGRGSDAQV